MTMNKFLTSLILWLSKFIDDYEKIKQIREKIQYTRLRYSKVPSFSIKCPSCLQWTSPVNNAKHYDFLQDTPRIAFVCGNCDHLSFWIDHGPAVALDKGEEFISRVVEAGAKINRSALPDHLIEYLEKRLPKGETNGSWILKFMERLTLATKPMMNNNLCFPSLHFDPEYYESAQDYLFHVHLAANNTMYSYVIDREDLAKEPVVAVDFIVSDMKND